MGNRYPGAAHLRAQCSRQAGVPVDRREKQLSERASIHGRNTTRNVTGLPGMGVPVNRFTEAVTTTESGTAPGLNRNCSNAIPVPSVVTVPPRTNLTVETLAG